MTEDQVRELVRQRLARHGDQRKLAIEAGISDPHLSLFLKGERPPPLRLLAHLGLEMMVSYTRKTACGQTEKGA